MEKKTPLYEVHVSEGGKIVPFADYLLPVQYPTGILAEHEAVRTQAGLFDVSHMGEVMFSGSTALASINHLITNDYATLGTGRMRYGILCNERGGCIDDLIVYKFGDEEYFVVVNAANREKDVAHMAANALPGTVVEDVSDSIAQLALQGPRSRDILSRIADPTRLPEKYYSFVRHVSVAGTDCLVSQSGYTGEFGYEIYTSAENAVTLWGAIRGAGEGFGLLPCGLGARDTLRLEASMPLYGHEMDDQTTPLEASLGFCVKFAKDEFIGRDALVATGAPSRIRVGLVATGRGIIREHQDVYVGDRHIGTTTSGTFAPHLRRAIAMAIVDVTCATTGTEMEVDVRGHRVTARIVHMPFYKHA